jgi:hypothetical protein
MTLASVLVHTAASLPLNSECTRVCARVSYKCLIALIPLNEIVEHLHVLAQLTLIVCTYHIYFANYTIILHQKKKMCFFSISCADVITDSSMTFTCLSSSPVLPSSLSLSAPASSASEAATGEFSGVSSSLFEPELAGVGGSEAEEAERFAVDQSINRLCSLYTFAKKPLAVDGNPVELRFEVQGYLKISFISKNCNWNK